MFRVEKLPKYRVSFLSKRPIAFRWVWLTWAGFETRNGFSVRSWWGLFLGGMPQPISQSVTFKYRVSRKKRQIDRTGKKRQIEMSRKKRQAHISMGGRAFCRYFWFRRGRLLFKQKTMKFQYPLSTAFFLDIESSRK